MTLQLLAIAVGGAVAWWYFGVYRPQVRRSEAYQCAYNARCLEERFGWDSTASRQAEVDALIRRLRQDAADRERYGAPLR